MFAMMQHGWGQAAALMGTMGTGQAQVVDQALSRGQAATVPEVVAHPHGQNLFQSRSQLPEEVAAVWGAF
jgi:hypothetical protein